VDERAITTALNLKKSSVIALSEGSAASPFPKEACRSEGSVPFSLSSHRIFKDVYKLIFYFNKTPTLKGSRKSCFITPIPQAVQAWGMGGNGGAKE
jgi:hypothetical protein